jgi:hypothetical protein
VSLVSINELLGSVSMRSGAGFAFYIRKRRSRMVGPPRSGGLEKGAAFFLTPEWTIYTAFDGRTLMT